MLARRMLLGAGAATLLPASGAAARTALGSASARMDRLERRAGGRLGVAALNLADGRRLAHRADERFAMWAYLTETQAGLEAREGVLAEVGKLVAETLGPGAA